MPTPTRPLHRSALAVVCAGLCTLPASGPALAQDVAAAAAQAWPQADARPDSQGSEGGAPDPSVTGGPGAAEPDRFHPAHLPGPDGARPALPEARRGGRVIVHLATMPRHLHTLTENSAVARWIQREVHESLLQRDWETWEWKSFVSQRFDVEDLVFLATGERLFGVVRREGDGLVVEPRSPSNPLVAPRTLRADEIERIERATVYTFQLRDDILWHDGHPFDARDVEFSWKLYSNPTVDCEHARDKQQMATACEVVDAHTLRFFCERQYFNLPQNFEDLSLTPRHVYDLSDPDNPDHEPGVDVLGERQGRFVNEHPRNRAWIGIGPYRITRVDDQIVDAVRFEDYFEPDPAGGRAGWVDAIRWRHIPDDDAAKTALVNGELDHFARLSSDEYFGPFTRQAAFTNAFYKGYVYLPRMQYVAWNMRQAPFRERDVRRALAHAFDWDEFIRVQSNGLGVRVTSTQYYLHPNYDHTLAPLPFDLELAEELLDDAGWYDRDGDGIRDKDGVPLSFEFLLQPGNSTTQKIVTRLQENLARIEVELKTVTKDYAALLDDVRAKEFDAFSLSWVLDLENDPEQLWERWPGDPGSDRSANYPGWGSEESDALIAAIQREVDAAARAQIHHRLQRLIYADQPYMFGVMPPIRFAVAQRVRNVKVYGLNPGYSIREWFLVDGDASGR